MMNGAKLAVFDPRLSNTASMSDYWMPTYPGTEAAVLLAMAKVIIDEGLYNRDYLEHWVNWEEYLAARHPDKERTFEQFIKGMQEEYVQYTPEYAAKESGVKPDMIVDVARQIGQAGTRFATHNWRSAGSGNLGGWAVARCLHFLTQDAPPELLARHTPGFDALLADLGINGFADLVRRRERVMAFLPELWAVAAEIIDANPNIQIAEDATDAQ